MANTEGYLGALSRQIPTVEIDGDGRIVGVGAALALLLGAAPEELAGRPLDELFPACAGAPGDRSCAIAPALRFQVATLSCPDSAHRLLLLLDVRDLHRARAECFNLTRLAEAGRLISSIVHEINNPLSSIIGYSQLLLMRELDADVRSSLEKVYSEALRTSRIVRNLLDFSRKRDPVPGRVRLGRVLRKALELKSHDLRVRNIALHVEVPDSLPAVHGDPHQLLQVFVNLIGNAEQAMYESDRGGRLTFEAATAQTSVSLLVRDTGPGVAAELRGRIFEPFFTTKEEGRGTGLGLALCRDILRQQQASIQLVDSAERGAAFLLVFQMHRTDDAAELGEPRRARPAQVRGRRILVVEDDPVCRSLVSEAFEANGNAVRAFDRSEAALKYLRTHVADVIISDLHRPGLNGMEFHEHVRQFDPALAARILFLTGDTLNDELSSFLRRTGNAALPKPVLLLDLFDAVAKLLLARGARQRTLFGGEEGGPLPRA